MRMMLAALAFVASSAAAAEPETAALKQGVAADGTRFYEDTLIIKAPPKALWAAFTDTDSYRKWAVPVAAIDFRLGGGIEASYDPKGHLGDPQNIKNTLIAYIPERLLVFRNVQSPDGMPGKEVYAKTVKTLEFEALGPSETRVTVSGIGFGSGAEFDQLYKFFSVGDGHMLATLKKAMETPAN